MVFWPQFLNKTLDLLHNLWPNSSLSFSEAGPELDCKCQLHLQAFKEQRSSDAVFVLCHEQSGKHTGS